MCEGRRGRKHRNRGKRGPCSYYKRVHRKGRNGDSCRGHKPDAFRREGLNS